MPLLERCFGSKSWPEAPCFSWGSSPAGTLRRAHRISSNLRAAFGGPQVVGGSASKEWPFLGGMREPPPAKAGGFWNHNQIQFERTSSGLWATPALGQKDGRQKRQEAYHENTHFFVPNLFDSTLFSLTVDNGITPDPDRLRFTISFPRLPFSLLICPRRRPW